LKFQYYKIFKTLNLSYLTENGLKPFCCYNSLEVSLCGGRIYSLCVDATVVLLLTTWDFLAQHGHSTSYQVKTKRPAYRTLYHSPVRFRDQHIVSLDDKEGLILRRTILFAGVW